MKTLFNLHTPNFYKSEISLKQYKLKSQNLKKLKQLKMIEFKALAQKEDQANCLWLLKAVCFDQITNESKKKF